MVAIADTAETVSMVPGEVMETTMAIKTEVVTEVMEVTKMTTMMGSHPVMDTLTPMDTAMVTTTTVDSVTVTREATNSSSPTTTTMMMSVDIEMDSVITKAPRANQDMVTDIVRVIALMMMTMIRMDIVLEEHQGAMVVIEVVIAMITRVVVGRTVVMMMIPRTVTVAHIEEMTMMIPRTDTEAHVEAMMMMMIVSVMMMIPRTVTVAHVEAMMMIISMMTMIPRTVTAAHVEAMTMMIISIMKIIKSTLL